MQDDDIHAMVQIVEEEVAAFPITTVDDIAKRSHDPYKVLISTIISSRTKDEVTAAASEALFARAETAEQLAALTEEEIRELIYPAGFYKTKAGHLKETGRIIHEELDDQVPDTIKELVKLPGVGRKTANLVVTLGFNKPGICVDTHVHRIFNRWGYISTKTPKKTEMALRDKLPQQYWIPINNLLVSYGQHVCKPISPFCSDCRLSYMCEQRDVDQSR